MQLFLPLILIFAVFYFLLIRPQQKKIKQHQEMLAAITRGDTVVTGGGLIGKVEAVKDDALTIRIANGVEVRALRSTISRIHNDGPAAKNPNREKTDPNAHQKPNQKTPKKTPNNPAKKIQAARRRGRAER